MNKIVSISIIGILLLGGICVGGVNTIKTMTDNNPPEMPDISGPSFITEEDEYIYGFEAIDSDGDSVYYFVDWGDGTYSNWIGPYYSGTEAAAHHAYAIKGAYTIHVKAKDNYGADSEWATYYPKWRNEINQQINLPFINLITSHHISIKESNK